MKKYRNKYLTLLFLIFVATLSLKCGISPEPINYGKDECENCRMLITDDRYGSELLTDKGKIYKFDSIECLIELAFEKNIIGDIQQTFLVTDFSNLQKLIDTKSAFYVHNDNFRSPMGLNVSAFGSETDRGKFLSENGGKEVSWVEVIEMVKQSSI